MHSTSFSNAVRKVDNHSGVKLGEWIKYAMMSICESTRSATCSPFHS